MTKLMTTINHTFLLKINKINEFLHTKFLTQYRYCTHVVIFYVLVSVL